MLSSKTLEDHLKNLGTLLDPHLLLAIGTDVINALRHLERYSIVHNHVTASSVMIQQCLGVWQHFLFIQECGQTLPFFLQLDHTALNSFLLFAMSSHACNVAVWSGRRYDL